MRLDFGTASDQLTRFIDMGCSAVYGTPMPDETPSPLPVALAPSPLTLESLTSEVDHLEQSIAQKQVELNVLTGALQFCQYLKRKLEAPTIAAEGAPVDASQRTPEQPSLVEPQLPESD